MPGIHHEMAFPVIRVSVCSVFVFRVANEVQNTRVLGSLEADLFRVVHTVTPQRDHTLVNWNVSRLQRRKGLASADHSQVAQGQY